MTELKKKAEDYLNSCGEQFMKDENGETILDKNGKPISFSLNPPTVSGLALALGFSSRAELLGVYSNSCNNEGSRIDRERFKIISAALTRIEEFAESRLFFKDTLSGAKFVLVNNFKGWSDNVSSNGDAANKLDGILCELREGLKS